jgi:DNA-binding transcriptional MerR regulator
VTESVPHSSIGEVLSLLQVEYPDVTISKIRFLESQGLLNPERTPSGYRKFRDEDIERLRWILTQQRDHFLPLKVIKERLAAGDFADGPPEGVLPFERATSDDSEGLARHVAANGTGAPEPQFEAEAALLPGDAVRNFNSSTTATTAASAATAVETPNDRARAVASLVEGPATAVPTTRGRKRHPTGHTKGDPTPATSDGVEPEVPSVSLTIDELCAQSGLSQGAVVELQNFGLLNVRSLGHVEYFDDDALVVARLAAGFGRFGIEPRHLRMYKVSADREAGLFEQLISPLLRQRRAAARDEAVEMLEELAELADDLRAVMVRASLREYLGQA